MVLVTSLRVLKIPQDSGEVRLVKRFALEKVHYLSAWTTQQYHTVPAPPSSSNASDKETQKTLKGSKNQQAST